MKKDLSLLEKEIYFRHPILNNMLVDENNYPLVRKSNLDIETLKTCKLINFNNIKKTENTKNCIVSTFKYDEVLERIWKYPLRYLDISDNYFAFTLCDFSLYEGMSIEEMKFNCYKRNRLCSLVQSKDKDVIPTVSWAKEETFEFCFKGIEKGSIVAISTIGVKDKEAFLNGFNRMIEEINPPLIILLGKIIKGMKGKFLQFNLKDTFLEKNKVDYFQLFELSNFIKI